MPHHFPSLAQPLQIERASLGAELAERRDGVIGEEGVRRWWGGEREERLDPGENGKERWRWLKRTRRRRRMMAKLQRENH